MNSPKDCFYSIFFSKKKRFSIVIIGKTRYVSLMGVSLIGIMGLWDYGIMGFLLIEGARGKGV